MRRSSIKKSDVPTLVTQYTEEALTQGRAAWSGDYKTANRHYDRVTAIYRELRERGRDAQLPLLDLLSHPDADVRCWAAYHALDFAPDKSLPVLEELEQGSGRPGLEAKYLLKQWREGTFKPP